MSTSQGRCGLIPPAVGVVSRERRQAMVEELLRTGRSMRPETDASDARGRMASLLGMASMAVGAGGLWPRAVEADSGADSDLFGLTNQDRTSNGVASLTESSLLDDIAENQPYSGCGFTVDGRAQDMLNRNYFAHPILNCGVQLVFNMEQANGITYSTSGENIGWVGGAPLSAASAASYLNTEFMGDAGHRDNILNAAYTSGGDGSAYSGSASWSGGGSASTEVWIMAEEFVGGWTQGQPTPPPTSPPTAAPTPIPTARPTARPTAVPTAPPTQRSGGGSSSPSTSASAAGGNSGSSGSSPSSSSSGSGSGSSPSSSTPGASDSGTGTGTKAGSGATPGSDATSQSGAGTGIAPAWNQSDLLAGEIEAVLYSQIG